MVGESDREVNAEFVWHVFGNHDARAGVIERRKIENQKCRPVSKRGGDIF